jgi:hypothetical protein
MTNFPGSGGAIGGFFSKPGATIGDLRTKDEMCLEKASPSA